MVQPIVARELLMASRRPLTWRIRLGLTVVAMIICLAVIGSAEGSVNSSGTRALGALALLVFCHNLLGGLFFSIDSISAERRQGTLGLLYLTRLNALDLIMGKLAISSLQAIFGQLALLPILAVPILTGGVELGQVLRVSTILVLTLLFSLSAGIFVSAGGGGTRAQVAAALTLIGFTTAGGGIGGALLICILGCRYAGSKGKWRSAWLTVLFGCLLPLVVVVCLQLQFGNVFIGSPFSALGAALRNAPAEFAAQLLALAALVVATISAAVFSIRWNSEEKIEGLGLESAIGEGGDTDRPRKMRGPVGESPLLWLLLRLQGSPAFVLFSAGFLLFIWTTAGGIISFALGAGAIPLLMFAFAVARYAAVPIHRLKESGCLEELFTTPVQLKEVVAAQHSLFWRLLMPILVVLSCVSLVPVLGSTALEPAVYVIMAAGLWGLFLKVGALGWLGAMYAYAGAKPNYAAGRALLLAGLAPTLVNLLLALLMPGRWSHFAQAAPQCLLIVYYYLLIRYAKGKLG